MDKKSTGHKPLTLLLYSHQGAVFIRGQEWMLATSIERGYCEIFYQDKSIAIFPTHISRELPS